VNKITLARYPVATAAEAAAAPDAASAGARRLFSPGHPVYKNSRLNNLAEKSIANRDTLPYTPN